MKIIQVNCSDEDSTFIVSLLQAIRVRLKTFAIQIGDAEERITVTPHWRCTSCDAVINDWGYRDLAERGIPVCPMCDADMELAK